MADNVTFDGLSSGTVDEPITLTVNFNDEAPLRNAGAPIEATLSVISGSATIDPPSISFETDGFSISYPQDVSFTPTSQGTIVVRVSGWGSNADFTFTATGAGMSLNLSQFQAAFKKIGKIIFLSQLVETPVSNLKKAHMALVDQVSTGVAADFDANDLVVGPLGSAVKSVASTVDTIPAKCKTAVETFMKKIVAVDLGLASGASWSAIESALTTQMTSVGAHVEPSGSNGSNDGGIAMYFADNFDVELNQNAAPSCPDTYITDTVL